MARPGRKRKINAKRRTATTRAARMAEDAGPTPEALERKATALGMGLDGPKARQSVLQQDASTPLAVLDARGLLEIVEGGVVRYTGRELREAGEEYARLFWRNIGTPWPVVSAMADRVSNGSVRALPDDNPERDARFEARFNRLYGALCAEGSRVREATNAVCVDGHWPSGAGACDEFALSKWGLPEVMAGLRALVEAKRGK